MTTSGDRVKREGAGCLPWITCKGKGYGCKTIRGGGKEKVPGYRMIGVAGMPMEVGGGEGSYHTVVAVHVESRSTGVGGERAGHRGLQTYRRCWGRSG